MNSLFGVDLPTPVNFVIAFVVVLLLIGAATWLVRRFGATRLDAAARGRQPRLAVIDSAAVDGRRKLVIIRRDNVEHLLMIGGPSDVVVETNIVRGAAAATRDAPPARNGTPSPAARIPLPDPTPWPLQPERRRSPRAPNARCRAPPPTTTGSPPTSRSPHPSRRRRRCAPCAPPIRSPASPTNSAGPRPSRSAAPRPVAGRSAATAVPPPAALRCRAADRRAGPEPRRDGAAARSRAAPSDAQKAAAGQRARAPKSDRPHARRASSSQPPRAARSPRPQPQNNLEQEMASLLSKPGKT